MAEYNVTISDLRTNIGDCLSRVAYGGDRYYVVRHGRPIAVVMSFDEEQRMANGDRPPLNEFEQMVQESLKRRFYCARCQAYLTDQDRQSSSESPSEAA